ncbi:FeoA family protein [Corynebacterium heidelbergense]|uniref:Ferrous iron transport protein A n=1 Tax=Corynebacterium heidelbergense TaxID=2055947 RepID=A0A364V6F8_9CORY|nr:FeoA family protein [Corynebacterium heidelbergense]RAV32240.1 ferrous iron transport protein A [Corynebacterium heidelbergense]
MTLLNGIRQARRRPAARATVERTLCDLRPGESAHVSALGSNLSDQVRRRLTDFGFDEGVEVTMLRRAPLGDPCVYRVRDYDLCLRRREAGAIQCSCPLTQAQNAVDGTQNTLDQTRQADARAQQTPSAEQPVSVSDAEGTNPAAAAR